MKPKRFLKTVIVSGFILLNILTVMVVNFPPQAKVPMEVAAKKLFPERLQQYTLQRYLFRIAQYAAITGLDPRWEMFSQVKGPDWRYLIEGVCDHGSWILPLPGQSKRPFYDEYFFDFKEGKFRLNTAANTSGRRSYVKFLCKQFQFHDGHRVKAINLNIQYQDILTPNEAFQKHTHYAPKVTSVLLEVQSCI